LSHEIVPETMRPGNRIVYRSFFSRDVKRADRVVAMSHGTADRLLQYEGRQADAIVLGAADTRFRPPPLQAVNECLKKYNLTKPYLLAVSTLEPRKNIDLLVKAFFRMKRQNLLEHHQLVLVGHSAW